VRIIQKKLEFSTRGSPHFINISADLAKVLKGSGLKQGNLTAFVVGSTAGVTTFEYEPGLEKDMEEFYEKWIPSSKHYRHDETWGDANGYSHLRAALTGPSLTIPFEEGRLLLGTWQQVVLAEFDNRPRKRQVVVQVLGE
jgi:secondary thiamine-phosphate synthase enzyme